MKIGYYDAMKVLYGLAGEEYDLDMELDEEEAYERLRAMAEPDLSQEGLRRFHEEILPQAGHHFFRNQSWTYKDLYIALLENTAASLRISRYAIYTEEELLCRIREKISYYTRANRPLPPYASFFE
jgi:NTE family protein